MEINAIFWIATIVMAVIAVGFVARPLLMANKRYTLLALAVAVPVVAAGFYLALGTPSSATSSAESKRSPDAMANASNAPDSKVGSVASMVDGLAQRLQDDPDDADSWLLLARSYKHLGRTAEALAAYENAAALGQFDAELAGLASGETVTPATSTPRISGSVSLSDAAASIVEPTDTVFIFAKAVDGPPMPVAVLRRAASELPMDFVLDDTLSMTPELKLSDFSNAIVTARISRGGDATVALRDLEAKSEAVAIASNPRIDLIIE